MRKVGREDPAREAYRDGVAALNDGLEMLRAEANEIAASGPPLSSEQQLVLGELVELFGARGGLLQRLGMLREASSSYSEARSWRSVSLSPAPIIDSMR